MFTEVEKKAQPSISLYSNSTKQADVIRNNIADKDWCNNETMNSVHLYLLSSSSGL